MKKLSKSELKAQSKKYFKAYPKEETLYATEDGNIFLGANKRKAEAHAKLNKLKVFTFQAEESEGDDSSDDQSKPISKMKTDELEAKALELGVSLEDCKNNDERKAKLQTIVDELENAAE